VNAGELSHTRVGCYAISATGVKVPCDSISAGEFEVSLA